MGEFGTFSNGSIACPISPDINKKIKNIEKL
jgi:hypothetical protein